MAGRHRGFKAGVLRAILAVLVRAGCAGGVSSDPIRSPPGTITTFILVRHPEKVNQDIDSPLSAKGLRRARDLVTTPEKMGVTAIDGSALQRNIDTARPLADRLGLEVKTFSRGSLMNTRQVEEAFVCLALARHAGGVVLWVGNSCAFGDWGSNLQ
jgi:hypothetical protein